MQGEVKSDTELPKELWAALAAKKCKEKSNRIQSCQRRATAATFFSKAALLPGRYNAKMGPANLLHAWRNKVSNERFVLVVLGKLLQETLK